MFENYLAAKQDLEAIEEALSFVLHTKMRFIFSDPTRIKNTLVVSYDSKHIYAWRLDPIKLAFKIRHNLVVPDEWQYAWRVGFFDQKITKFLPKEIKNASNFQIPKISGGLLTPFIELQKKKDIGNNPYTTKESYLATIMHELGHVYWNSPKLWWPSNKTENLFYLETSLHPAKDSQIDLRFPTPQVVGEIFAFCSEYFASSLFWPSHKINIDKLHKTWTKQLIKEEGRKDLEKEDSVLEPTKTPHAVAIVFGKIILSKYPKDWPHILTDPNRLRLRL